MENSLEMRVNQRVLELDGKAWKLDFDMQALSYAEQVYLSEYGRDVNVSGIIAELTEAKLTAVMAFCYGAMRSAGERLTWEAFSKTVFTWEHFDKVFALVSDAILELFSGGEGEAAQEDDPKN